MNQELHDELLAMKERDLRVRERLAADGALWKAGYHPEMEAVHRRNAARLAEILAESGWPGSSRVGDDGAEAAWLIVQHAIGEPALQRSCLVLLQAAVKAGEALGYQPAYLEDRIRVFEGRKQIYGTQIDNGRDGQPVPFAIEDPDNVDERRHAVGLKPIAVQMAEAEAVPAMGAKERARWERSYEDWLRRVGWRP